MSDTNNQIQKKESKIDVLKKQLDAPSVQEQFKNALSENSGTFVASLIDLYGNDAYLQNCAPGDVIREALKAAVLKLPIIKSLGFSYIVPYKSNNVLKPQFQIGYKGLIQLAMRTNQYRILNADVVYEGEFKRKNKLTGEFDLSGEKESDTIVGYFAHFEMLNGFAKTLYMTKSEMINYAQKYSKSYANKSTPWHTEADAMSIKTVLRRLLTKWGYLSIEMIESINEDEEEDVSDRVGKTIQINANKKEMGFDDVEEAQMVGEEYAENDGPGY